MKPTTPEDYITRVTELTSQATAITTELDEIADVAYASIKPVLTEWNRAHAVACILLDTRLQDLRDLPIVD